MLDAIGSELPQVLRDLAIAGIAFTAYDLACRSTARKGSAATLLKGALLCAGVAVVAAALLGQGSCVSGDPLFGYCDERAGAYVPSLASRAATFVYWLLLLGVPVAIGAFDDKARLKSFLRKPSPDAP